MKKNRAIDFILSLYKNKDINGLINFAYNNTVYSTKCFSYAKRIARMEAKRDGIIIKHG